MENEENPGFVWGLRSTNPGVGWGLRSTNPGVGWGLRCGLGQGLESTILGLENEFLLVGFREILSMLSINLFS